MTTTTLRNVTLDTGQKAIEATNPYSMSYQCPSCGHFAQDCVKQSHFDGDRWVSAYFCWDCIERRLS